MCGIFGDFALGELTEEEVRLADRLTDLLAHRGPDRRGLRALGRCVLGNRRLSIIDLDSRADQPFSSPDGRYTIVYNGEIYNYRELRQSLDARGYAHRTTSDTEVLLNCYRCWGEECLPRLEGMFAFAIYDTVEQRLFAARDHIGQKPFYYTRTGSRFLFASELRPLLEHPSISPSLSIPNFQKYLLYEFYPWDATPVEGIFKLPPASSLTCDTRLEVRIKRYWDSVPGTGQAARNLQEEFEALLWDSVRKHLIADVPVGAFVSGGIDSSLIAALASEVRVGGPGETFTVAVRFEGFDESPVANSLASHIQSTHHEFPLGEVEAAKCTETLLPRLDEPIADPGVVPSFFLARCAREHIKVAVAGDGGDELGAGYITFRALGVDAVMRRLPSFLLAALRVASRRMNPSDRYMSVGYLLENFLKGYPAPSILRTQLWIAPLDPAASKALISAEWQGRTLGINVHDPASVFADLWAIGQPVEDRPLGDQMLYLFQKLYLPEYVCAHTDRMSMLHGLEVRSPFIHRPLIELLNAQPLEAKLRRGRSKLPFYRFGRMLLPNEVVNHPKHGFTFPVGSWLRSTLRPVVNHLLSADRLACYGLLNVVGVRKLVEDHLAGRANRQKPLWALMVFQQWLENFPQVRLR